VAFLFSAMALEAPLIAALNRLLGAQAWAREQLAPFAGKLVELRAAPLPALRLAIDASGLVAPAPPDAAPAVVATLRPGAIDLDGEEQLAATLRVLLRHLRWDVEEDLSRLFGDVVAHRLVQAGRELSAWGRDATRRIADSVADYLVHDKQLWVRRGEMDAFAQAVAGLRERLERLQARARRLE